MGYTDNLDAAMMWAAAAYTSKFRRNDTHEIGHMM